MATTSRKFTTIGVAAFAFLSIVAGRARSEGLDTPVVPKTTIGSEIKRGGDRAFHCELDFNPELDWLPFSDCISGAVHLETQRNTLTDPYALGLYFTAFIRADYTESDLRKEGRTPAPVEIFDGDRGLWWREIKHLRATLKLNDQQICKALGLIYSAAAPTLAKWKSR